MFLAPQVTLYLLLLNRLESIDLQSDDKDVGYSRGLLSLARLRLLSAGWADSS